MTPDTRNSHNGSARTILAPRIDLALLVLRLGLGITMLAHGYQKVFTFGFAGITDGFTKMGIPMPGVMGPFISLLELLGGIALIFGLLTRLAALGLAFDMLGALLMVHLKNGFFMPTGFELVFILFTMSLAVALGGAGAFSIDAMIANRRSDAGNAGGLR